MNRNRVTGIVPAGGAGVRLGAPKATVVLGGVALITRAVAQLSERCDDVIVVTRPSVALPAVDARVVCDRPGPAAAIVALATALAAADTAFCVVLACDLPFAAPVLGRMPHAGGVAVDSRGLPQPLCARYPRVRALAACERLIATGQLAVQALVTELRLAPVPATGEELLNINTPEDLARAEAILAGQTRRTSTTAL